MRGTRLVENAGACPAGIIPAYAGNTNFPTFMAVNNGDHPRICGEHIRGGRLRRYHSGSSPHMRGTHADIFDIGFQHGIIPAYAGNTSRATNSTTGRRDHPRICGEHQARDTLYGTTQGSSPHMRGTLAACGVACIRIGIIPAYAGNTLRDYSNFVVSKFMSFVFHLV